MKRSGPLCVITAIIAICSLLFTELAVASYVCPDMNPVPAVSSSNEVTIDGCGHADADEPSLCRAHCDGPSHSVGTPHAPPVQPFVAAGLTMVLCDTRAVASIQTRELGGPFLQRSTAPPLAIRNCCFRI
jgi:hypothetical protein